MLWKTFVHMHNDVPRAQLWPIYPLPSQAEWVIKVFVCGSGTVSAHRGMNVAVIEALQIVSFRMNPLVKIGNLNEDLLNGMNDMGVGGCAFTKNWWLSMFDFLWVLRQKLTTWRWKRLKRIKMSLCQLKTILTIILPLWFLLNLFSDVKHYDWK